MKKFTQEEFDNLPRNEYGLKECPTGDYTNIKVFGGWCNFGKKCNFGERSRFGEGCSFGEGSNFGKFPPPPTQLLLCDWGRVSDTLTTELMRFDASNHPHPELFDEWAKGGRCPYTTGFARCASFKEDPNLWKSGKAKSARELAIMLLKEKKITYEGEL